MFYTQTIGWIYKYGPIQKFRDGIKHKLYKTIDTASLRDFRINATN